MTSRQAAFSALKRVGGGGFSTIVIDTLLSGSGMSTQDSALAAGLFYGVLENEILLDHLITKQLTKPNQKLETDVRIILRLGLYQLALMDRIPDSAAVNESVKLAKDNGLSRASGFINAVLRGFIRKDKALELPDQEKKPREYLSIRYSCPMWLIDLWLKAYGRRLCEQAVAASVGRPPIFARVNNLRTDIVQLSKMLEPYGVKVKTITWLEGAVELSGGGDLEKLPPFVEGLLHIQDISSQLCCQLVEPKSGEAILDVCSAPGGKAFTLSEISGDKAYLLACDIYEQRVILIENGARRLGLTNVETLCRDAVKPASSLAADKVLCDVPCSGLGVIRRKPDIKAKKPSDIDTLPQLQYDILSESAKCVRPCGMLVYSTCTLNPDENEKVVERFLKINKTFKPLPFECPQGFVRREGEPDYMLTVFPDSSDEAAPSGDGFFIARMVRVD